MVVGLLGTVPHRPAMLMGSPPTPINRGLGCSKFVSKLESLSYLISEKELDQLLSILLACLRPHLVHSLILSGGLLHARPLAPLSTKFSWFIGVDTGRGATLGALNVEVRLGVWGHLRVEVSSIFLVLLVDLGF